MNPIDCRPKLISEMERRFRCSESVAEDAVDEAIARILKVELRRENIFPLLYQISKNVILDRQKRAEVAKRKIKIMTCSLRRPATPLQQSMSIELEKALAIELASLNDRERKAFELYYIDGLSHEEVALKIGASVGCQKTLAFRVRRILRDRLERFAS